MPQFGRNDDLLTVAYVAGPYHVWLGLKFSREPIVEPAVVKRPPVGRCSHDEIDQDRLVSAVVAGLHEYNLYPRRIEYIANDSPAYDLYTHCARLLAERAAKGQI